MDIIRAIEQQQIKQDLPEFNVGDNVKVHYRIKEGNRERIQVFQGDVIRRQGASVRETFTGRKISLLPAQQGGQGRQDQGEVVPLGRNFRVLPRAPSGALFLGLTCDYRRLQPC